MGGSPSKSKSPPSSNSSSSPRSPTSPQPYYPSYSSDGFTRSASNPSTSSVRASGFHVVSTAPNLSTSSYRPSTSSTVRASTSSTRASMVSASSSRAAVSPPAPPSSATTYSYVSPAFMYTSYEQPKISRSFESPVAKKISGNVGRSSPSGSSSHLVEASEDDLVITLAVKFAKAVANGGSAEMKLKDLKNSLGVGESVIKSACRSCSLFQYNQDTSTVECLAFVVEVDANNRRGGAVAGYKQVDEKMRICYSYNCGSCRENSCQRLHVCCKWLFGRCENNLCPFEHNIGNSRNHLKLFQYGVISWTEEKLKFLFLAFETQMAMVCKNYNSPNGCKDGQNCGYFHICSKFIDRKCSASCNLNHRVHGSENRQKVLRQNGIKRFDRAEQLMSRLRLKLSRFPQIPTIGGTTSSITNQQNNPGRSVGQTNNKVAVWKFKDNDGSWKVQGLTVAGVSFGLHVSLMLEEAFQSNQLDQLVLKIGPYWYSYSQGRMEQTNSSTGVSRQLKRELVNGRNYLPPEWMPMVYTAAQDGAVLFPLEKTDDEYKKIRDRFNAFGGVPGSTILEIYRVQNPYLRKGFHDKKAELIRMYRSNGGPRVEEMSLLHGTKSGVTKHICEQNFDWRRSGEANGNIHGQGAYFAKESSYSHNYTDVQNDGTRLMFVANVLVGTKVKGASTMRYPPDWKPTIQYDTTVDDVGNSKIFVKYDKAEYYPAYIVQYCV